MASIIDKIKSFLGIHTKNLLGSGEQVKENVEDRNNNGKGKGKSKRNAFLEGLSDDRTNSIDSNRKEIKEAFEKYQALREKHIELNGKENKTYMDLMRKLGIPSRYGLREAVIKIGIEGTIAQIINKIYDKDPTILNEDRREELIEKIMNTDVEVNTKDPTRIDETEEEIDYYEIPFREYVYDKLFVFSKFDKHNKKIYEGFNIREIIEKHMSIDEFSRTIVGNVIDAYKDNLENASVCGEKFGVQYALVQATSEDLQLPEELEIQGVKDVKDYKKRASESFLAGVYAQIEYGMPDRVALLAKKFINTCVGVGEGLTEYSLEEFERDLKEALEQDERDKKLDGITRNDYEITIRFAKGFLQGIKYIGKENKECTKFFDVKRDEEENSRYVIYEGTPKKPELDPNSAQKDMTK